MPKVSIIIPVYNVKKYMVRSVNSVLRQTIKDIEVILVDDGSTDGSGRLCEEYRKKDTRVRVIHQKNGGMSSARNSGVQIAEGDYIGFVDSDDYIETYMYERLLKMLETSDADVAVCGAYDVYKNTKSPQCQERAEFVCDAKEMFRNILLDDKVSGSVCNKLIKAEVVRQLNFIEGKLFEDAFYSTQLVQQIKLAAVTTEPMYYYVHRANSVTTCKYRKKDLDVIEAFKRNQKLVEEKYPELKQEAEFALDSAYLRVFDKMLLSKGYRSLPEYAHVVRYIKQHSARMIHGAFFLRTRKIAVRALCVNVSLYRLLLLLNERVNRKQM